MLLAAALLCAGRADAGTRATYWLADEEKLLVIDIADNGDASLSQVDGDSRIAVIGGHTFAIFATDEGMEAVSFVDMARAFGTAGAPALDDPIPVLPAVRGDIAAVRVGPRTVAGVGGTAYRLKGTGGLTIEGADEFVATTETRLQPVGVAIGRVLEEGGGIVALFDQAGPNVVRWMKMFGKLAALGTPIECRGVLKLLSVETRRIPPETIALPGAPVPPDKLIARIRATIPGA